MTHKQVNVIIGIIYGVAAILVLTGAFFRIQHYPNGPLISGIGFIFGTINIIFDQIRLKKKIKKLENQLNQKE